MTQKWLAQFGEKLSQWRDDPCLFVEEALGATPVRWQREALQAVITHDRLAIRSGHGVGKSAFIAWLIIWWELTHIPNKIAVTANRQDQLSDIVWAEIKFWVKQLNPALQNLLEVTSDKVTWKADPDIGFAVARTARKEAPEAFQGFHSKHMLFLADEASGVDDIIFEVGQGAMSTPGAKTILTGNPTRTSGYFYNAFHKNKENWWTRKVSSLELIEEGAPYVSKDFPDQIAKEYGIDSNVYRYRVLGEFAVEDDDAVIPRGLIEAAINRDVEPTGRIIWGLDVARFGDDSSALCKRRGNSVMEKIQTWKGKNIVQTSGRVIAEYNETKKLLRPEIIMVDSIGIGAGVADNLREAGLPVRDINVSETASASEKHNRLRDELWWRSREWFQAMDCRIVEDQDLIDELSAVKYDFTSSGKIIVESKNDLKKRGLKSPNRADAFNMTNAALNIRPSKFRRPIEWAKYQTEGYWV